MAIIVYNFAVWCLRLLLRLISPFHPKARKMIQGRSQWQTKLSRDFQGIDDPVVWFHCASLGEFEQGRPLLDCFSRTFPEYKILLTFYSPSGYEIRKNYEKAYAVHYLPWDTRSNARDFFDMVKPKLSFIIKYEFWYYLIREGNDRNIPVMVCSSIFHKDQVFFRFYGGLFRNILSNLHHIFVQDSNSSELLKKICVNSVTVAGDTRMDRVATITESSNSNEIVERFLNGHKAFIVGSSWPEDIVVLAALINSEIHMKVIIAPHEINDVHLGQLDKVIHRPSVRYSEFTPSSDAEIMIIDTIGILSHLYQYGKYAFIGGAFGKGLHNTLEAATFGLPLFFGNKNYLKFREAASLVEKGGAFAIADSGALLKAYQVLEDDETLYHKTREICRKYVIGNTGATKIIMDHVLTILKR